MWYKKNFYNLGKTPCIWFHLLTFIADFQTNNTLELGTRVYKKKIWSPACNTMQKNGSMSMVMGWNFSLGRLQLCSWFALPAVCCLQQNNFFSGLSTRHWNLAFWQPLTHHYLPAGHCMLPTNLIKWWREDALKKHRRKGFKGFSWADMAHFTCTRCSYFIH